MSWQDPFIEAVGIKPFHQEEAGIIWHADCLEIMKKLPDKCVDLVLTSPPFKDEDVDSEYWPTFDSWFRAITRTTARAVLLIHSATKINYLMATYPPKRLMIWGKGHSKYSWRFNPILVYQLEETYSVNRRIWSDCFAVPALTKWMELKQHKYQDPVNLYKSLVKMMSGCEIILDPFLGSGTTAVAAKALGRRFIGIEISEKYARIAVNRLRQGILL